MRGRPTKLTEQTQRTIVEALEAGAFQDAACEAAGISRATFYGWLKRGRAARDSGGPVDVVDRPFLEFLNAVERARAVAEVDYLRAINAAARTDWRAAAWVLAHGWPDRWGPGQRGAARETDGDLRERLQRVRDDLLSNPR
jgi:hypothetical protein